MTFPAAWEEKSTMPVCLSSSLQQIEGFTMPFLDPSNKKAVHYIEKVLI